MATLASRAVITEEPLMGHTMEPLTSIARRNRFPVGSTNCARERVEFLALSLSLSLSLSLGYPYLERLVEGIIESTNNSLIHFPREATLGPMALLVGLQGHQDIEWMDSSLLQQFLIFQTLAHQLGLFRKWFQKPYGGHFPKVANHGSHGHILQ